MILRVIVREDDTTGSGPAKTTFKTFDVDMPPELVGYLCSPPRTGPVTRTIVGAETVEAVRL